MKSRDEIGKNIFDFEDDGGGGGGAGEVDEGWSRQSLAALEDNSHIVRQREREIQKIVQSISELNAIFKDLASMVSEQVNLFLFWAKKLSPKIAKMVKNCQIWLN